MTQSFLDANRILTWTLPLCIFSVVSTNDCPQGWMGPNCRFKCHCKIGCLPTGECVANDTCQTTYFGDACQYRDLAQFSPIAQIFVNLTDSDDTTCMPITNGPLYFLIMRLTIIRIVAEDEESFDKISFEARNGSESRSYACYPTLTITPVGPYVRDYYCDPFFKTDRLFFKVDGTANLCTVNINGGRNLALKQEDYEPSSEAGGLDGKYPIDNYITYDGTCFNAKKSPENSRFIITFNVPVMIYLILIILGPDPAVQSSMRDFQLNTYDPQNQPQLEYKYHVDEKVFQHLIHHSSWSDPVAYVEMNKDETFWSSDPMQFCEFETYGECVRGSYGLDCTKSCGKCRELSCRLFGECQSGHCDPGYYGPKCDEVCPEQCELNECDGITGRCSEGCQKGYMGDFCNESCPGHCELNGCDVISGRCSEGCQDGYLGDFCNESCPEHCDLNGCDVISGRCSEGCQEGYMGNFCNQTADCLKNCEGSNCQYTANQTCPKGCKKGFFLKDCSQRCPTSCRDKECNRITGFCEKCETGMYGKNCSQKCPKGCHDQDCNVNTGFCEKCESGTYGRNCSQKCNGRCHHCDINSGNCTGSCIRGFHGETCDKACNKNCLDSDCEKLTADCGNKGCVVGFHGDKCTIPCTCKLGVGCDRNTGQCLKDCLEGFYGPKCENRCSCHAGVGCDRATGQCLHRGCSDGLYGPNCENNCSTNCMGETKCNPINGMCFNGCNPGFYNSLCSGVCPENCMDKECTDNGRCKECDVGYFGTKCKRSCSPGCKYKLCERDRGDCANCLPGYSGDHCEYKCSNCAGEGTCDKATRECLSGCKDGYRGSTCEEEKDYLLLKLIFFAAVMVVCAAASVFTFCRLKTVDPDEIQQEAA